MDEQKKATQIDRIYDKFQKAQADLEDKVYRQATENARYLRGKHWSDSDISEHTSEGFKSYSIPLLATKINRVLAVQRTNRFDSKCFGRSPEDEIGAEVKNYGLKYILDYNKFKYIESDMYRDGLAKKFGVICAEPDYDDNPEGEIVIKREQWRDFFWDTNAKEYDLSDATFMGVVKWLPLDKVQDMFPDFTLDMGDLAQNYSENGVDIKDWCDPKTQIIKVVFFFELSYKTRYICKNLKTGDYDVYNTKAEAETAIQEKTQMLLEDVATEDSMELSFSEEDFGIIKRTRPVWKKIVFSGKNIIEEVEWKYSIPPYHRYACFEDDGEIWSLTDLARDPQKMFDRYTAMADKSTAKNIKGNNYQVVVKDLAPEDASDMDGLARRLSSGGALVGVQRAGAITPLEKQNDISVEVALAQTYQSLIEDIMGGRSFQGLESETAQTATEVAITENNAKQVTSLFLDNLARWKVRLTQYLVELMDDVFVRDRKIRIMGEVRSQEVLMALQEKGLYEESVLGKGEYGYLNTGKLPKPLKDYVVDVQIDDVTATTLDRQAKFTQLLAMNQIATQVYGQPLPFEFILQYANLDPTVKAGLVRFQQKAEAERKQQMALAQATQKVSALSSLAQSVKPETPEQQQGTPTASSMHQGGGTAPSEPMVDEGSVARKFHTEGGVE